MFPEYSVIHDPGCSRAASDSAALGYDEDADAGHQQDGAIDCPGCLACHEAAWKHVDPLQKPHASDEHAQHPCDILGNSHRSLKRMALGLANEVVE